MRGIAHLCGSNALFEAIEERRNANLKGCQCEVATRFQKQLTSECMTSSTCFALGSIAGVAALPFTGTDESSGGTVSVDIGAA